LLRTTESRTSTDALETNTPTPVVSSTSERSITALAVIESR
jgi:hypothetical protein